MPTYSYTRKVRPDSGLMSTNDRHDDSGGGDEDKRLGILVQDALPGKAFRIGAIGFGADSLNFYFDNALTSEEQTTLAGVVTDYTPKNAIAYVPPVTGLFTEWAAGPDALSYIPFSEGVGNPVDTINEDAATVQEGTWVQVNINGVLHWALQFDGVTEKCQFDPLLARIAGMTTKGTQDLLVRMDTYVSGKVLAGISDYQYPLTDSDSFAFRVSGSKVRGYVRFPGESLATAGHLISDGNTHHLRITHNTTSGVQLVKNMQDNMSSFVSVATPLDAVIQNAGTKKLSFGASSNGNYDCACSVIEYLARDNIHSEQLPEFAP